MINNRQSSRRRGRGGTSQGSSRGSNPGQRDSGNRVDSRSRGNAAQLLEKYKNMARDAQMSGDRVQTEYYLQFADHYFRVLADSRARSDDHRPIRPVDDFDGSDEEYGDEGEPIRAGEQGDGRPQQSYGQQPYQQQPSRDAQPRRDDRPRDDRSRDDRPRDERTRDDRTRDDRPRDERQTESRQRDDRSRDDRQAELRQRDVHPFEARPSEPRPRDDRQAEPRARDDRPRRESAPREDARREEAPRQERAAEPQPQPAQANGYRERVANDLDETVAEVAEAKPARRPSRSRAKPVAEAVSEAMEADRLPPALGIAAEPSDTPAVDAEGEVTAEPKPKRRRRSTPAVGEAQVG